MKFLLIQPPLEDFYTTPIQLYPLGLLYVAGVLKKPRQQVQILDCLVPNHPVLLIAWNGHGFILNSKAMLLLQIAEDEPDPIGGSYDRVPDSSQISGRLWDYAKWKPLRILANQAPDEDAIKDLRKMADEAMRFGITSMQIFPSMSIDRFARLLVKADLPIRVRAISFSMTNPSGRDFPEIRQLENSRVGARKTSGKFVRKYLNYFLGEFKKTKL